MAQLLDWRGQCFLAIWLRDILLALQVVSCLLWLLSSVSYPSIRLRSATSHPHPHSIPACLPKFAFSGPLRPLVIGPHPKHVFARFLLHIRRPVQPSCMTNSPFAHRNHASRILYWWLSIRFPGRHASSSMTRRIPFMMSVLPSRKRSVSHPIGLDPHLPLVVEWIVPSFP